jgi:hypothetical protein
MSGVIDENGQQWEKCKNTKKNGKYCGDFVLIDTLYYEEPTEEFPYGRDLCPACAKDAGVTTRGMTVTISLTDLFGKKEN